VRLGYAVVLVLLPPSEGKADLSADQGRHISSLDLASLSFPELTAMRERVLSALVRVSSGSPARARTALGVSRSLDAEVARNQHLREAPAAPAGEVYRGVLYEAMGRDALPAGARNRLDDSVVVTSALFGAVRLTDQIPAYRLSGDARLGRLGRVSAAWRGPLKKALPRVATEVVFDLRSTTYASMWTPEGDVAERTAVGRVLHRRPDGSAQVVSHFNKATKGRIVAGLARRRAMPGSIQELVDALHGLGYDVALGPAAAGKPRRLDIVVDEL
jgi:uncharacterized protein